MRINTAILLDFSELRIIQDERVLYVTDEVMPILKHLSLPYLSLPYFLRVTQLLKEAPLPRFPTFASVFLEIHDLSQHLEEDVRSALDTILRQGNDVTCKRSSTTPYLI